MRVDDVATSVITVIQDGSHRRKTSEDLCKYNFLYRSVRFVIDTLRLSIHLCIGD